jgi:hypothetical protein
VSRLGLVLLLFAGRAYADVSVGAKPAEGTWLDTCVAGLRQVQREALSTPASNGNDVEVLAIPSSAPSADCSRARTTIVTLRIDGHRGAGLRVDDRGAQPSVPWTDHAGLTGRDEPGRSAYYPTDLDPALARRIRHALDVCIDLAPAPVVPLVPPEALSDAERAAWDLEHLCIVEGRAIGASGGPGRTQPLLKRITALGQAATPLLLHLARSTNPAARAVAAMGMGEVRSHAGRVTLERLTQDHARSPTIFGCDQSEDEVASFATRALARYR